MSAIHKRPLTQIIFFIFLSTVGFGSKSLAQSEFETGQKVTFTDKGNTKTGTVVSVSDKYVVVSYSHGGQSLRRSFIATDLTPYQKPKALRIDGSKLRTWVDSTGGFSTDARVVGISRDTVELIKRDGTRIELAKRKLSHDDQVFVAELKQSTLDHLAKKKQPSSPKKRAKPTSPTLEFEFKEWKVQPDEVIPVSTNFPINSLRYGGFTSVRRFSPIRVSRDGQILTGLTVRPSSDQMGRVRKFDLETGDSKSIEWDPKQQILSFSPNGKYCLSRSGNRSGSLVVWELLENKAKTIRSWTVYRFLGSDSLPSNAEFIDDEHFLTIGTKITLWKIGSNSSIYSMQTQRESKYTFLGRTQTNLAFSANRKLLAIPIQNAIYIVETMTGSIVGKIRQQVPDNRPMAFSHNGRFLAFGTTRSTVIVWDLVNDQKKSEFLSTPSSLVWCGDDKFLLTNSRFLYNVDLGALVWRFEKVGGKVVDTLNGQYWHLNKNLAQRITLPHPEVVKHSKSTAAHAQKILYPGAAVKLDIQLEVDFDDRKNLEEYFKKELTRNGFVLKENADVVICLRSQKTELKSYHIRDFFMRDFDINGKPISIVKASPQFACLEIKHAGNVFWQRQSRVFGPQTGVFSKNIALEGESAKMTIERLCRPTPQFFMGFKIPSYYSKLPESAIGKSRFSIHD